MNNRHSQAVWMLVIIAIFFALDCMSIHSGDDLGYMFADTVHHNGDGPRVTTLWQCFTTQASHYCTTNGRFVVHVVVMAVLNFLPLWAFRLINALMFALLWLIVVKLINPSAQRLTATRSLALFALFCLFPQPGMVLLTLVSYAVNYLWVSVAALAFVLHLRRRPDSILNIPLALIVGSLHEGWSIPLGVALFILLIQRRLSPAVFAAFVVGTAVEVFAPGNLCHAGQGGGFTADAILRKVSVLCHDLSMTIISPAVAALLLWSAIRFSSCQRFIVARLPVLAAIITALMFAALTYTSPRQLTCPVILTLILILEAVQPLLTPRVARKASVAAIVLTVGVIAIMAPAKYHVYMRWQSTLRSVDECRSTAIANYTMPSWLPDENDAILRAIAPDPLANRGLQAIGDRYTIRGLSRLRKYENPNAPSLTAIWPDSTMYNDAKQHKSSREDRK